MVVRARDPTTGRAEAYLWRSDQGRRRRLGAIWRSGPTASVGLGRDRKMTEATAEVPYGNLAPRLSCLGWGSAARQRQQLVELGPSRLWTVEAIVEIGGLIYLSRLVTQMFWWAEAMRRSRPGAEAQASSRSELGPTAWVGCEAKAVRSGSGRRRQWRGWRRDDNELDPTTLGRPKYGEVGPGGCAKAMARSRRIKARVSWTTAWPGEVTYEVGYNGQSFLDSHFKRAEVICGG
ncbi:hypothetical protein NL676_021796 [Syzygium grande]|nr:hypothetical protein NL676_021796 [Syzygium grande]